MYTLAPALNVPTNNSHHIYLTQFANACGNVDVNVYESSLMGYMGMYMLVYCLANDLMYTLGRSFTRCEVSGSPKKDRKDRNPPCLAPRIPPRICT